MTSPLLLAVTDAVIGRALCICNDSDNYALWQEPTAAMAFLALRLGCRAEPVCVRPSQIPAKLDAYLATIETAILKLMWDTWADEDSWGQRYDAGCNVLESIHRVMNRRGEGAYVAI